MPEIKLDDTIAAIATPIGEGGISVIRISGPHAVAVSEKIFEPIKSGNVSEFKSHSIHLGKIHNEKGNLLDQTLLSFFKAPHSYTGEDVIELSLHGGLALTRRVLNRIIAEGVRHAEPGEFTKRAFLNGKLDLTQAEAVLDLIKSKSERSIETSANQLAGNLSKEFKIIKENLMKIYAHMEAFLDFPEEDIEIYSDQSIETRLCETNEKIQALIQSFQWGSLIREGIQIVIVGKPNVGKSSLFNAMLSRDRALVSEYAGTTRDQLEEFIELEGVAMRLVDTAGFIGDGEPHPLEQMGIERTRRALKNADLYLFVVDSSSALDEDDKKAFAELSTNKPCLVLMNKSDLELGINENDLSALTESKQVIKISTASRQGLDDLEKNICDIIFRDRIEAEGEQITRERHRNALQDSKEAIEKSLSAFKEKRSLELVTHDLKIALDCMQELIGEIYSEDLLDVIFAEFCIGK